MAETYKTPQKIVQNWVIVNRHKMESEFGVHVNAISIVDVCTNKLQVLKALAKLTQKELSWMVVSEFNVVNGKPGKYKIGVPGPEFLEKESILFN